MLQYVNIQVTSVHVHSEKPISDKLMKCRGSCLHRLSPPCEYSYKVTSLIRIFKTIGFLNDTSFQFCLFCIKIIKFFITI